MTNIDKTKFIQTYGIDDDNFLTYLNKFGTLKKIVAMGRLDVIPKEKLNHLYNKFIYYNSLGHNLDTIVNETTTDIRTLFFFNSDGYFEYNLPVANTTNVTDVHSRVTISGRTCQIKIYFKTTNTIPKGTHIFELIPAPFSSFNTNIDYLNTSVSTYIDDNGLTITSDIQTNTTIAGTITYIIKK